MTWLTWRLQRIELSLLLLMFLGLAGILALSRDDVELSVRAISDPACVQASLSRPADCFETPGQLYQLITTGLPFFNFLPLFAALLLALPIVSELENGTFRFAWTQSITRAQWARIKFGTLVIAGLATAAILAATFHWWSSPKDAVFGRLDVDDYDLRGTLPVAHTLYAIGLMLAAGTLLRRTIPAMAVGAVVYLCTRVPFIVWVREHLVKPETSTLTDDNLQTRMTGAWQLSVYWTDAAGNRLSTGQYAELCRPVWESTSRAVCENVHNLTGYVTYHPASHYWPLQLTETAIFLCAGVALIAFAAWYILRRVE